MNFNPLTWFTFLQPKEGTPEEIKQWRNKVAFAIVLLGMWTLAMGAAMEVRHAKAEDLTTVAEEVKGLREDLTTFTHTYEQKEEERRRLESEASIRNLRQQIYTTQRDYCQSSNLELRSVLLTQIDSMKTSYRELAGTEYPPMTCAAFE